METAFRTALSELAADTTTICRHEFGPVSFLDEEQYDQLGELYAEAVTVLEAKHGEPIKPTPDFQAEDVERATCWLIISGIVYVLLSFRDNTRQRVLILGVARQGTIVTGCWES